jgi:hypothetical protein
MKVLRYATILVAVVACASLGYDSAASALDGLSKPFCSGFKPETRALCWKDRL